jgi:Spy/CpxP family protein refolding chaperone
MQTEETKVMRIRWLTIILIFGVLAIAAAAQGQPQLPSARGGVIADPSDAPVDDSAARPRDALNAYEQQMALVTTQTYAALAEIAQAVREGKISSDEAQHLTRRSYELGLMRLQFLDTLHEIVVSDLSKQEVPGKSGPQAQMQTSEETLVVVPPASSPDIPESVAKYLELTPAQIAAIQARITQDSSQIRPLVQQLSENQKALASIARGTQSNDDEIRKLAAKQSRILERLIVANSRLERAVYEILTAAQRQKLDRMAQGGADVMTRLFAER